MLDRLAAAFVPACVDYERRGRAGGPKASRAKRPDEPNGRQQQHRSRFGGDACGAAAPGFFGGRGDPACCALLLLMAGDVESNPGPRQTYPCGQCGRGVGAGSVRCRVCDSWWHGRCARLRPRTLNQMARQGEEWTCLSCLEWTESAFAAAAAEVSGDDTRAQAADLQAQASCVPQRSSPAAAERDPDLPPEDVSTPPGGLPGLPPRPARRWGAQPAFIPGRIATCGSTGSDRPSKTSRPSGCAAARLSRGPSPAGEPNRPRNG